MDSLWELFITFIQIGFLSVGGGMASIPIIQNKIVSQQGWLTLTEFTDLITIAEMTPGPIAVNSATFIGLQIQGIPGAIIATFGCILPSLLIVSLLFYLYDNYQNLWIIQGALSGIRSAVVALIASAGLSILLLSVFGSPHLNFSALSIDWIAVLLFTASLFALKYKITPIKVMLLTGVIGSLLYLIF